MRFAIALVVLAATTSAERANQQSAHTSEIATSSLCMKQEFVIATCPVGRKIASVCGPRRGHAIYRFGRPGRIELESQGLRHSNKGYAGGGETQVYFTRGAYTYFLFDNMTRTGFGLEGQHDAVLTSGLVLQHKGRFRRLSRCPGMDPVIMSGKVRDYMPEGPFIEHWGPTTWQAYQRGLNR